MSLCDSKGSNLDRDECEGTVDPKAGCLDPLSAVGGSTEGRCGKERLSNWVQYDVLGGAGTYSVVVTAMWSLPCLWSSRPPTLKLALLGQPQCLKHFVFSPPTCSSLGLN